MVQLLVLEELEDWAYGMVRERRYEIGADYRMARLVLSGRTEADSD